MKSALVLVAAVLVAAPATLVAAPAVAAAPSVDIVPGKLPRGADSTVPRMDGKTIVDGDIRVKVKAEAPYLLGASGEEYVVAAYPRVLRVDADGETQRIARYADDADLTMSGDGEHLLLSRIGRQGSTIRVLDAETGDQVAKRRFNGYVGPLDADEGRTVLTGSSPERTLWWNFLSDATKRINGRAGGAASIPASRLTTFTGDPYEGGCAVVTSLRHPRKVLWRSCEEAAVDFSPNGRRMATVHILSDGLGPGEITTRRTKGGKRIATYRAFWFSSWVWETNRALILEANSKKRVATVRCEAADCERASKIRRR